MRFPPFAVVPLLFVSFASASDGPGVAQGECEKIAVEAKLYKDHQDVAALLGPDIEEGIVAVEVTIRPKNGEPFHVYRDDFMIRSDKDGQKSKPYDPGQIASASVLRVTYTEQGGAAIQGEDRGPVWGGWGGQRPGRLPGNSGGVGNSASVETPEHTSVDEGDQKKDNPLLMMLRQRCLAEEEVTAPATGLLYFPLSGNHKIKHIWLHYRGDGGKLDLQFDKVK